MPAAAPPTRPQIRRAGRFRYGDVEVDERSGTVRCRYDLDGVAYLETVEVGPGREWTAAAHDAARLVHLLAGVSYYKAGAAHLIDLGELPVRPGEREFLRSFYLDGLGEFAYRNGLSLEDVEVAGGTGATRPDLGAAAGDDGLVRPLVPFGGGIDSLVTAELVSGACPDTALFVLDRRGVRFAAIERAAAATGLAVLRAERELDPRILRPPDPGAVFNGHVPVTGVVSAVAVLMAVLDGRDTVVMANEWSASHGNLVVDGRVVNHQWSKSATFEDAFRAVLAAGGGPDYFSLLRPFSELWVAQRFAALERFHGVVHSCNRAFHLDPAKRLDRWCGRCDKCCFIDLILAPFLEAPALAAIFGGPEREPLADATRLPQFRALVGVGDARKPFECVGDVDECRTAVALAAERPDRAGNPVLAALAAELGPDALAAARVDADRMLAPLGPHHVPRALLAAAGLG